MSSAVHIKCIENTPAEHELRGPWRSHASKVSRLRSLGLSRPHLITVLLTLSRHARGCQRSSRQRHSSPGEQMVPPCCGPRREERVGLRHVRFQLHERRTLLLFQIPHCRIVVRHKAGCGFHLCNSPFERHCRCSRELCMHEHDVCSPQDRRRNTPHITA